MTSNTPSSNRPHITVEHQWTEVHIPTLNLALAENRYDVVILQETLLNFNINLKNYNGSHNFYRPGTNRGTSIFVRTDIIAKLIHLHAHCGSEVKYNGVTLSLPGGDFHAFNVYCPPTNQPDSNLTTFSQ